MSGVPARSVAGATPSGRWWTSPLIWVALAAGLGATATVWQLTAGREAAVRGAKFAEHTAQVGTALTGRLWAYEQLLRGASALFYASSEVTEEEWRAFARRVEVLDARRGITSLGFIVRAPGGGRAEDRFLVRYLEAADSSGTLRPGSDLGPDPVAREVLDRARRANDLALSGRMGLPSDPERGWLLAAYPVFRRGREGEADGLMGYVFAELHLGDLVAALPMALGPGVRLQISDQLHGTAVMPLFAGGSAPVPPERVAFRRADQVPVYGRVWDLEYQVERGLGTGRSSSLPRLALLGGLLVTALASGLAASEVGRHRLARQQARTMGVALESTSEALIHEVAEQQLTQQALRQSEARVRAVQARARGIVSAAMDGIILLDGEGRIELVNPAAERIFGVRAAEVMARSYAQFVPERHLEWYLRELAHFRSGAVRERILGADQAAWLRRRTGEEFPVEATVSALDVEGVRYSVVVLRDVSERLRAERERTDLERQLRQAQKLEAVGTLAGGLAHDFNNLLGAILGHVELAGLDLPASHPARESLEQAGRASLRARDLVRHILTFSRRQEQQRAPVAVSEIVAEVVQLLRAGLPASLVLTVRNQAGAAPVVADASQLHQVLVNLCTNAAHAIGERPGHLEVMLDAVTLDAAGAALHPDLRPGRYFRIGVRDDGMGMTREVLDRIYEPFFTTKPAGQGTGLGLSVVHGIVRAHDGAIRVESTPGIGSLFEVFLPAAGSTAPAAAVSSPSVATGAGQRILVVDDEAALASVLTRLLTRLGYRVRSFNDPMEALRAIAADPDGVDALVTDLTMPGLGGRELAERVRLIRPDLPILFTSGYLDPATQPSGALTTAGEFLAKPVTLQALAAAVHRLLSHGPPAPAEQPAGA